MDDPSAPAEDPQSPEGRQRLRDLLDSQHDFPGRFEFRAVTRPGERTTVVTAVTAAGGDELSMVDVFEKASGKGNWVSIHLVVQAENSDVILRVYEVLHSLEQVVMTL